MPSSAIASSAAPPAGPGSVDGDYQQLFALCPGPLWVYDAETLRFLAVNVAAEHLYGWSAAEFAALTVADVRHDGHCADPSAVRTAAGPMRAGVAADGAAHLPGAADEVHHTRDGRVLTVRVQTAAVAYAGRPARLVLLHDVTAERAAAAEDRELFAAVRDMILVFDCEGTYTRVLPTAPTLRPGGPAGLLGRRVHDVLPAATADRMLAAIRRVLASNAPEDVAYTIDLPTGLMHVTAVASPMSGGRVCWVGRNVTALKRTEAALRELSTRDELTGLLNRRGFLPLAEEALATGRRTGRLDAMLCVDLDDFKPINDEHGHAAGDAALRATADLLRTAVREGDLVARLGGDEFAVFAGGLSHPEDGHALADRLREALAAHNAQAGVAGRPYALAFSVGVAERTSADDVPALLARADAALYAAKAARPRGRAGRATRRRA